MIIRRYCVKICLFKKHDLRKHLKLKLLIQRQEHALEAPHLPSGVYIENVVDYEIWSNYVRAKIG